MVTLVRLIGIVLTVAGVVFLLNPETMKRAIAFFAEGKRVYAAGCIRILVGIILLTAASQCRIAWIVFIIALLPLISGILVFALGLEKCKNMIKLWQEKPVATLRAVSVIPVVIGLLLFACA
ncbi:MAG: hypothetical protein ABID83_04135 [Candidatus Omnitrophota bacterium]